MQIHRRERRRGFAEDGESWGWCRSTDFRQGKVSYARDRNDGISGILKDTFVLVKFFIRVMRCYYKVVND